MKGQRPFRVSPPRRAATAPTGSSCSVLASEHLAKIYKKVRTSISEPTCTACQLSLHIACCLGSTSRAMVATVSGKTLRSHGVATTCSKFKGVHIL